MIYTFTDADDEEQDSVPAQPVDAYGKLLSWLVEMADGDDIDLNDPDVIQQFQRSAFSGKLGDSSVGYWSESYESHGSSETPQCSKSSTRSCEDIEEEASSLLPRLGEDTVQSKSIRASPNPLQKSLLRHAALTKQSSIPYTKARSESPKYKRSSKSYSDLNDSVTFRQNLQEQILLQSQKRRQVPRTRNRFVKQYSESHADYTVSHFHDHQQQSSTSSCRSSDSIVETKLTVRDNLLSRQTTFSDDDDVVSEKRHPHSMFAESLQIDEPDNVVLHNRRKRRGRFVGILSRSVGSLMEKSSRLRNSIRRKSSSLFTVRSVVEPEEQEIESKDTPDKVLDDKLLDGNIADILFAVDALWPKK